METNMPDTSITAPSASGNSPLITPRRGGSRMGGRWLLAVLAAVALAGAGCGSSSGTSDGSKASTTTGSSTSATYPADKQEVCQARDQLKTSVTALTKPSLLVGGSSAINAAVKQVQTDAEALKAAAKSDSKDQVDALESSLEQLQTDAGKLGNGDVSKNLQAVGTDVAAVGTSSDALFTQLKETCGS